MTDTLTRIPTPGSRISAVEVVRYETAWPVFIVGSVRSGTSAMMAALRNGAGIRGFNEGVLANLLPTLLQAIHAHYSHLNQKPNTMLGNVAEDFWINSVKNLFGKAFIETMGEGRWLDKTPGGAMVVPACPSLLEIFPNAKFIFCKRRAIENVLSRQSKFGGSFEKHCREWVLTMQAWLETAPLLGDSAIVVDQREMAVEPDLVAGKVAEFLDLSAEQRDGVISVLRGRRLEQTRPARDDVTVKLSETGWTGHEQDMFRQICGPMMAAFGYGMDEDRAPAKPSVYRFFVPVNDGVVQRENVERRGCRAVDATRFKIIPNGYGLPPAGIRHRMVDMNGFRRFSARVRSIGAGVHGSDGLLFRFALERADDRTPVFSTEQVVKAGPESEWICDLPALTGRFDAVLSVQPVSDRKNNRQISALWSDAQLS